MDSARPAPETKRPLRSMLEMIVVVAAAIFFALTIQAFAIKPYRIPSGSMLPTLKPGQRILVDRFSHLTGSNPAVGDITVFTPPRGAETSACGVAGQGPFYGGQGSPSSLPPPAPAEAENTLGQPLVGLAGGRLPGPRGRGS